MARWGNLADRFWPKLVKQPTGCWEWPGPYDKDGYGKYGSRKRPHRIAVELVSGPLPPGAIVCHRCDNPPCCNPDHLFVGTHKDNLADRNAKGRQARGERSGQAKLTRQQVLEIYHSPLSQGVLSKKYGTAQTNISSIKNGKAWKWLTDTK